MHSFYISLIVQYDCQTRAAHWVTNWSVEQPVKGAQQNNLHLYTVGQCRWHLYMSLNNNCKCLVPAWVALQISCTCILFVCSTKKQTSTCCFLSSWALWFYAFIQYLSKIKACICALAREKEISWNLADNCFVTASILTGSCATTSNSLLQCRMHNGPLDKHLLHNILMENILEENANKPTALK